MPDDTNPYTPPRAAGELAELTIPITHGDLEQALAGNIRLDAGSVMREAWSRVSGMKWISFASVGTLWMMYAMFLGVAWAVMLAIGAPEALSDPSRIMEEINLLNTSPVFIIGALLQAPAVALLYLGVWNLGLRRSVEAPLRLVDAFPFKHLGPAVGAVLVMNAFTALQILHPLLSFVSFPILYLLCWVFPFALDRDCSFVDAMKWSATLTAKNLLPLFMISAVAFVAYIVVACTMGIGLIWWLPFCINLCGICYRDLCGVQRIGD